MLIIFKGKICNFVAENSKLNSFNDTRNQNRRFYTTEEELVKIPDIGDIIAKSVINYFQDNSNKAIVEELKDLGINMNYLGQKVEENEFYFENPYYGFPIG